MKVIWQDRHHSQLSAAQLYQLLALRNAVFIVEQNCPYQDIDGADLAGENRHLLGMSGDRLMACARLLAPAEASKPVKIGRVIVASEARGLRLGNQLMEQALACCAAHWLQHKVRLSAQAHLEQFYGSFGFKTVSDVYLEDNIPHIDMEK
ncbi:GNAT family N-acetyltransferase [Pantoea sp. FN060301]|uniref:GNAT family N-acetyltransferase n=1 Tax=Pantoea sp. FN060301 TaxID=3420380 RepID=UPI003D168902